MQIRALSCKAKLHFRVRLGAFDRVTDILIAQFSLVRMVIVWTFALDEISLNSK
ncbi:hypothetical protein ACPOL_0156 [Acidisarcina polymorpha]|uniref:Uncharacterized protein n=1 Tax=Acidisarcina polymorpha TaxID=2211140 RepID=A0A2Z5FS21_9BACT|nr:hypothetical protein ACPOL_0156 [Acidisarcina polymorpha]